MGRGREAAFPRPYSEEQPGDRVEFAYSQSGMTMREWYAGMALQGILANPTWNDAALRLHGVDEDNMIPIAASMAFAYADAMLAKGSDK